MSASSRTSAEIALFRLATLRAAVKLEALGLKRKGRSATAIARAELGAPRTATRAVLIAALDDCIAGYRRELGLNSLVLDAGNQDGGSR
jgi:hypothetical protein